MSGLPVDFFDITLLWRGTSKLSRRVSQSVEGRLMLPSWSWAGWKGPLDTSMWQEAAAWVRYSARGWRSGFARAVSLHKWSYKQSITDDGILIANNWHEFKTRYTGENLPCPPRWTRHRLVKSITET